MKQDNFDWDQIKSEINIEKHGVSFYDAQSAFLDPDRVIAEDINHSWHEKRYYCFGQVENEIMTVRFTYRGHIIRIIGAGFWRKGKKSMSKKTIKYKDEPIGKVKIVTDFLPHPDDLVIKDETVKITLSLSKSSVEYFKLAAKKNHTQYQKMIRILLDRYAAHYQKSRS